MSVTIATMNGGVAPARLLLGMAATPHDLWAVQRLRYRVFIEEAGLAALRRDDGLDADEFDAHCDHLIVRDGATGEVVGTYRVLGPAGARRLGRGYSDTEFDLGRLEPLRGRMAEAGRACIHPAYRGGSVIMMLWSGLVDYMLRQGCDYMAGCASIGLADGGRNAAAVWQQLRVTHLAPADYRVTPRLPFALAQAGAVAGTPQVPPLLKGYLRSGAWICGEPAWDPAFDCADLFVLLPLTKLDARLGARLARQCGTGELAIAA